MKIRHRNVIWDPAKAQYNLRVHGVDFSIPKALLEDSRSSAQRLTWQDTRGDLERDVKRARRGEEGEDDEVRMVTILQTERWVCLYTVWVPVFAKPGSVMGDLTRLLSCRKLTMREIRDLTPHFEY